MHEHTDMKIGENTLDTLFYYLEKINICNIQYVTSKSMKNKFRLLLHRGVFVMCHRNKDGIVFIVLLDRTSDIVTLII